MQNTFKNYATATKEYACKQIRSIIKAQVMITPLK